MRGFLLAIVLAGSAIFACGTFGSDDAEPVTSDAGAEASVAALDAGVDGADGVDGGAPEASAPTRSVKCSGNTCTSTACCMEDGNVGACDAGCAPNMTTVAINCDDSTDCPANKTCCVLFDSTNVGNVVSIACASSCTDGLRACVQDADDCPGGQSCVPLSTAHGGNYFPNFTFFACK